MHNKIPGLDHLRALAIVLVFLFHYRLFAHPQWVDDIGSFGWTGVDLFFVLSGYLIASQVFAAIRQERFSVKIFYLKRSFRILPVYWVVMALYFLVPSFREWEALAPLWKFLTFTQNLGLDLRHQRTFSHAWSLCIEEQFYLLFPLTAMAIYNSQFRRLGVWLLVLLFLSGFAMRYFSWANWVQPTMDTDDFGWTWYKYIYYPTYNRLDGLLMGISIAGAAQFYSGFKSFVERWANVLLVAGIAILIGAYSFCEDAMNLPATVFGFPLIAIGFGSLVASATSERSVLNRLPSVATGWLARLSYAIYLVHKAAIHFTQVVFEKLGIQQDGTKMFLLSAVVSVLAALLLHIVVEQPFMRWRDKMVKAR